MDVIKFVFPLITANNLLDFVSFTLWVLLFSVFFRFPYSKFKLYQITSHVHHKCRLLTQLTNPYRKIQCASHWENEQK